MQDSKQDRRGFLKTGRVAGVALLGRSASAESPKDGGAVDSSGTTASSMPTRNLGRTGHKVALFSLGGQSALEHSNNEAVAIPIIERALDLGVNYIDTSSIYGGPTRPSERYIGQVLKRRRPEALCGHENERTDPRWIDAHDRGISSPAAN